MANKNQSTEGRRTKIRNRISGAVAVLLGLAILVSLVIENRWDNHHNNKPLKALAGSIMFIIGGLWYIRKGEKAEPWSKENTNKDNLKLHSKPVNHFDRATLEAMMDEELATNATFQEEYQKTDKKYRDLARKLESQSIVDNQSGKKKNI